MRKLTDCPQNNRAGISTVKLFLALLTLSGLIACSQTRYLVGPPNQYLEQGGFPDTNVAESLRTASATILFATDRLATPGPNGTVSFGRSRSPSLMIGSVDVQFGSDQSWTDLRNVRAIEAGKEKIQLSIGNPRALARFPNTPLPFRVVDGSAIPLKAPAAALRIAEQATRAAIRSQMRANSSKDVFIFIHGVNNEFEDASYTMAEVWHYTGRTTVPILYSWPAGNKGLTGYFKDREAGEFSVFHLKMFLRLLSEMPEIRNINILAHSRGTDIATTALREMVIETRAKGQNPRKKLKIANLILAAPDLDFGVVEQRLIAEAFGLAIGQITVYMNSSDSVLRLSQSLMAGKRFGRIQAGDISESDKTILANAKNVHFIDIEGEGGAFGHSYFNNNPAVLSDIGIAVNQQARPGSPERPLINVEGNFWRMPGNYP